MFKKLYEFRSRFTENLKYAIWDMKTESLMNRCRDTGGESSPYFKELQNHLSNEPKKD